MNHPATFSKSIMNELWALMAGEVKLRFGFPLPSDRRPLRVLDPFAGVGTIHDLDSLWARTWGVEIEMEWASLTPGNIVADSTRMPFRDEMFDIIITSPCYGNRMADKYDGKGLCQLCHGWGGIDGQDCARCKGTGRDKSTRRTYRIALDRMPTNGSAAMLQWGEKYRDLHRQAWQECHRVLARNGLMIVNVSDHIRKGERQPVVSWHVKALNRAGFAIQSIYPVETRRYRFGANQEARVDAEHIIVARASHS